MLLLLALSMWFGIRGTGAAAAAESYPGQGFLPDNRAWEMVSPPGKNGNDVSPSSWRVRVADDGSAAMFASLGGFADAQGVNTWGTEYIARRDESGWQTHSVTPSVSQLFVPQLIQQGFRPSWQGDLSDDLSKGVFFAPNGLDDQDPNINERNNLYRGTDLLNGIDSLDLISSCPGCASPLPTAQDTRGLAFAGASADFSHIIFESGDNLTGQTTGTQTPKLYEWLAETNELRYVGVLPDTACGSPPCLATTGSVALNGAGGGNVGATNVLGYPHHPKSANAISEDGSKVFFTAAPFGTAFNGGDIPATSTTNPTAGDIYVRDGGVATTRINVSERTDCATADPCSGTPAPDPAGSKPAVLSWALPDGSSAFFLTKEKMTDDDQNAETDLYRSDLDAPAGERLTLISSGEDIGAGNNPALVVLGVSDDGEFVYYLGDEVSGDPGPLPNSSRLGMQAWHNGDTHFIADHWSNTTASQVGEYGPGNDFAIQGPNTFRMSADGRHVTFGNNVPTVAASFGYDNHVAGSDPCEYGNEGRSSAPQAFYCQQIYAYDAEADELACASCNPSGERPGNDAMTAVNFQAGPLFKPAPNLNNSINSDGSRIFFSSEEALVPEDQNNRFDVYQYDVDTGEHHLLTTGQDDSDSWFMNATSDGSEVLFTTREQLVGVDTDSATDLYAARVDGGLASQNPVTDPSCQGDSCQEESSPPPAEDNPGSGVYAGPGNTDPGPNCQALDRKADKLSDKARKLKKKAKKANGKRKAKKLKKKARKAKRKAKKADKKADKCWRNS